MASYKRENCAAVTPERPSYIINNQCQRVHSCTLKASRSELRSWNNSLDPSTRWMLSVSFSISPSQTFCFSSLWLFASIFIIYFLFLSYSVTSFSLHSFLISSFRFLLCVLSLSSSISLSTLICLFLFFLNFFHNLLCFSFTYSLIFFHLFTCLLFPCQVAQTGSKL